MDQTTKPLFIPPEFALYAEKHNVFELYQRLLSHLIIHKPEDPMQYLIEFLKKDNDSSSIIIIGPPSSGKKTHSKLLAKKTGSVLLTQSNLIEFAPNNVKQQIGKDLNQKDLQPAQWAKLLKARIEEYDCVKKGWILENFPETRAQSIAMLAIGVIPKHVLILDAPDSVLIERAAGKRVDSKTGDIYHTTFEWPSEIMIQQRLTVPDNNTEEDLINRLIIYHRNIGGIKESLKKNMKQIHVDQPKGDVFNQVLGFVNRPARSNAPIRPRIILIGPYGSGKRTQANAISKKYDIVNVSITNLIKEAVSSESMLGLAIKPHLTKKTRIPDSLVLPLLKERLGQSDCISRGWVLTNYPKTREQAEALESSGISPNRVFFMDIPNDSIMERTTLRHLDPITGERYHMLFNPPPTQEIRDRLHQKPTDSEDVIKSKLSEYYSNIRYLHDFYETVSLQINADQDANIVFEMIESAIVNQLPKETMN